MLNSHEYFQDLISMYALDAVTDAERNELHAHLKECAECRKLYQEEKATVSMLPRSVQAVAPAYQTKQKLFAHVDADLQKTASRVVQTEPPRRRWFAQPVFAFGAIALIALLAIGGWLVLSNQPSPEQQTIASILNDPNVQQVSLAGTKDAPSAWGQMYMVPGHSQAVLKVGGLEQLPHDKGYEFWFIRGQDPQASNMFTVNSDGTMTVLVKANDKVENFNAWGVSVEPKAGVEKPTGTIVILGGS